APAPAPTSTSRKQQPRTRGSTHMTTITSDKKQQKMHFLTTYKFNWRKGEQDPVVDRVRTCMQDSGYTIARIARDSGVAYGTLSNWMDGTTMRPQYATLCAATRAMGFDFAVVPTDHKVNGKAWNAAAPKVIKRFRASPPAPRRPGVSGAEL